VPLLNEEADYVFARELGELNKWKQFSCFDLSARLVHYISNRILVGPDLCRQADYRATTEALNMSHVIYGAIWNFLPLGPFRRTVYWVFSIPYRFQIRRAMKKYLIPIIEERMAHQQDPNYKRNLDTIQLMVDMPPASPKEVDSFRHAIRILHLHFASTGSTIALLHNCLWQMLQMPECTEPMRAEMGEVLEKYGSWDSRHTLNHLHLLDSFVREVLRLHVPSACKSHHHQRVSHDLILGVVVVSLRLATQPVTLHDGLLLRPGTKIAFPAQSIHLDPSNYTNPTSFIPFRFSGTGSCNCGSDGLPKDAGRLKAEALDDKYLPFGYGKQACPGRFFALRVVKLVLARLVWEYDIKWAGQAPKSPTSGSMEGFFLPSKKGEVMLKQRGV
jgi:cytochrome P450